MFEGCLREIFCEDVGLLFFGVDVLDSDSSGRVGWSLDVCAKMMVLDRQVFCTWTYLWCYSQLDSPCIVFKDGAVNFRSWKLQIKTAIMDLLEESLDG